MPIYNMTIIFQFFTFFLYRAVHIIHAEEKILTNYIVRTMSVYEHINKGIKQWRCIVSCEMIWNLCNFHHKFHFVICETFCQYTHKHIRPSSYYKYNGFVFPLLSLCNVYRLAYMQNFHLNYLYICRPLTKKNDTIFWVIFCVWKPS